MRERELIKAAAEQVEGELDGQVKNFPSIFRISCHWIFHEACFSLKPYRSQRHDIVLK